MGPARTLEWLEGVRGEPQDMRPEHRLLVWVRWGLGGLLGGGVQQDPCGGDLFSLCGNTLKSNKPGQRPRDSCRDL